MSASGNSSCWALRDVGQQVGLLQVFRYACTVWIHIHADDLIISFTMIVSDDTSMNNTHHNNTTNIRETFSDSLMIIYTIICLKSVCRRSQTAGRNSCSIASGDVSN